jgi:hypothetical protein
VLYIRGNNKMDKAILELKPFNHRQWVGIDQSALAIQVAREKLGETQSDLFSIKPEYEFVNLKESVSMGAFQIVAYLKVPNGT